MAVVAGIDVGKANLDVSISEGPVFRFENTAKGIAKLLKHLKEQDTTMAVCESTGGYERLLVSRLRKTEILGRLDKGVAPAVAKSTKRHIVWLEKEIARLNQEYQAALQSSAPMARRAALYRTVPGVGALTAATLVAHLPELGHWDSKALTSLVGVAPWSRDSGQKRGQRAIRGGRRVVRRALYICAWSVIRVDGQIRRFYQSLRQRGKPGKVALVAVMRKLLLQLNAVARRGTPWVAQTG